MGSLKMEEINKIMEQYGHRYHRKYCWHCNRHTIHEDGLCLDHEEELLEEEQAAEEDRRVNEDAQYAWSKR